MNSYHFEEHHLLLPRSRCAAWSTSTWHRSPRRSTRTAPLPRGTGRSVRGHGAAAALGAARICGGPGADLTSGLPRQGGDRQGLRDRLRYWPPTTPFGLIPHRSGISAPRSRRTTISASPPRAARSPLWRSPRRARAPDVSSMKTRAVKDGASWVLNGGKIYITFGSVAHCILVFARAPARAGAPTASRPSSSIPRPRDSPSARRTARWASAACPTCRSSSTTCASPPRT